MDSRYDGIILGTGHNALVLQAYLCRCGLRVLSLDRAATAGGGLATIQNPRFPGYWHNTHSFYHRGITAMPWYRDLELERHGARYVEPELNVALILPDGRSLQWWSDVEKTAESFRAFSRRDADTLCRWAAVFRPVVEQILIPEAQRPPLPPAARRRDLERSSLGRQLLDVSALSPLEFVEREFTHDTIRAGLLFFNGLREVDLRLPGFGHAIPALLASRQKAQMCLGGSARLAEALVSDIREHGGHVQTDVSIAALVLEAGEVTGVELTGGERVRADAFVASGLNPQQTFLELLPADRIPHDLRAAAAAFEYNMLAPLFSLHLALDEPPQYRAAENDPRLRHALMVVLGLDRMAQFHEIVRAHELGRIPPPVMWGTCPTVFDPSQAPAGKHTAFMWEKAPYALNGQPGHWDEVCDQHARDLLGVWSQFAPNVDTEIIVDRFATTPRDVQLTLPNMAYGDLLVGSFAHDQIGYHRPFAGAGQYRTAIPRLYLCGGSTHPGGNITGLCGYNAASVIAADVGQTAWWNPPSAPDPAS